MTIAVRQPPGPDTEVDLYAMRSRPLQFLEEMFGRYGDFSSHRTNGELVYLVGRPDLARQVLKEDNHLYTKTETPDDAMLRPLLGDGLLTSSGDTWARQRRMCAPAFRRTEVERYTDMIVDAAERLIEQWRPGLENGNAVRLDHQLTALTLSVLVKAILGAEVDGIGPRFGAAVDGINGYIGRYLPGEQADADDAARRRAAYRAAATFLNAVVSAILAARRAGGGTDRRDLLGAILAASEQITPTQLRDQVLTLVMAGHETTAKALSWTLYLLDRYPAERRRVEEEVDRVLGGRRATAADLPDLQACRRAVAEAMRLYPPVWLISRRAVVDSTLGEFEVPAGTLIAISPFVLHRHPAFWVQPTEYMPERFITDPQPSHLYLPFGGGARVCLGQHLATVETVLVLATLAQRVRLELVPGFPVEPEALVTLRPRHGLMMIPRSR
jgi:cytochrome P450